MFVRLHSLFLQHDGVVNDPWELGPKRMGSIIEDKLWQ